MNSADRGDPRQGTADLGQDTSSTAPPVGILSPRYAAVTVSVLTIITLVAFETMAVTTVMPTVTGELRAGSAYGLAFSLMFTGQLLGIVLAGAWTERRGALLPLVVGVSGFAGGSGLAGVAASFEIFLAGRLTAGLGAGLAIVAMYVIIGAAYPIALRPKVFGWVSAAWVLPSVLGPLVAAVVTEHFGWRVVFLLIPPLAGLASLGIPRASRLLAEGPGPEYRSEASPLEPQRRSLARQLGFGVPMTMGATALQIGTSFPHLPTSVAVVLSVGGLAVLAGTVPALLPPGTMTMRAGQPAVMLARLLLMASFNGTIAFVPLMLVEHVGLDKVATGVLLALASIGWAAGSFVQSRPAATGRGPDLIRIGAYLLVAATAFFLVVDALELPSGVLALCLVLIGVSMGIGVTSTSVLALELAPAGGHASASASLQIADVLGSVLGIAAANGIYALGRSLGQDPTMVFWSIWALTSVIGMCCWPAARRIRPPSPAR